MTDRVRVAVFGAGSFGRNHVRVLSQMAGVELVGVIDTDGAKARELADQFGTSAYIKADELPAIDAAVVATPTVTHESMACGLLQSGVDVLIEKPIADSATAGERLTRLAETNGRILQVGHLERFNPAVEKLGSMVTMPLFWEVHRLSLFTPRSLDVDVVLDLMIHDIDIVLSFTHEMPNEVRAAGISVLSPQVDIANVRLSFASGCVANLTASRVSTEQVRKLRLFQPGEYLSLDYGRQELARIRVLPNELQRISYEQLTLDRAEPLQQELSSFFQSVRERTAPRVNGRDATDALRVAEAIRARIAEHSQLVAETIRKHGKK